MEGTNQSPTKRPKNDQPIQGKKRAKKKKESSSLPPSQERLLTTYFPKISATTALPDCIQNREICEQAITLTEKIHPNKPNETSQASNSDDSIHSASQQSQTSQILPPNYIQNQLQTLAIMQNTEQTTPSQQEQQPQQHPVLKEGEKNKEVNNLFKLIKTQMDAVDLYIKRVPAKESRKDELIALDKINANLQVMSSSLLLAKSTEIKLQITQEALDNINYLQRSSSKKDANRRESIFQAAQLKVQMVNQQQTTEEEEGSLPPAMISKMNQLIEEKLKKAAEELKNVNVTSPEPKLPSRANYHLMEENNQTKKRTDEEEEISTRPIPPPPSKQLQEICLTKAKEFAKSPQDTSYIPIRPSSLWLTSMDNQQVDQLIDEANYTTLPGKVRHGPAWEGSLATKITFRTQEQALNAAILFKRNIRNLSEDINNLIHVGTPSFGAWKLFELRTEFVEVNFWERTMQTTNINDPKAIETLVQKLCQWNQGSLWNRDIRKALINHGKCNINEAALILKVGPLTFDFYKVMKKQGKASLNIQGERSISIFPLYTPYCCWGCYSSAHLKNGCPNPELWKPQVIRGKPYCGLCEREGLSDLNHKAAMKGCPIFDAWAVKLESKCTYFRGGY